MPQVLTKASVTLPNLHHDSSSKALLFPFSDGGNRLGEVGKLALQMKAALESCSLLLKCKFFTAPVWPPNSPQQRTSLVIILWN